MSDDLQQKYDPQGVTNADGVTSRVRYFDGQFLKDQDFVDDQKYHIDRQRRVNRLLRVSGICEGLTLEVETGKKLYVTPGTALDSQGRLLVLTENQEVRDLNVTENGTQTIYIAYQIKADTITQGGNEIEEANKLTGTKGATRLNETPLVSAIEPNAFAVALGKATMQGGVITVTSGEERKYSGVYLPSSAAGKTGVSLRSGGTTNSTLAILDGGLHVKDALEVTSGSSPALKVNHTGNGNAVNITGGDLCIDYGKSIKVSLTKSDWPAKVLATKWDNSARQDLTQLFVPGSKSTNNSIMTLRADGNVGIGTDSPSTKLNVSGTFKVTGTSSLEGNVGIGTAPSTEKQLKVGGNTAITGALSVDQTLSVTKTSILTGNVGIGTAPGNEQLKVGGNTAIAGDLSVTKKLSVTETSIFAGNVGIGTTSSTAKLEISGTLKASGVSHFTGNVGIGTTPGGERLKVEGNAAIAGALSVIGNSTFNGNLNIKDGDLSFSYGKCIKVSPEATDWKTHKLINVNYRYPHDFVDFYVPGTSSTDSAKMTILGNGNVGIGTTDPNKGRVHIDGFVKTKAHDGGFYYVNRKETKSTVINADLNKSYSLYASNNIAGNEFHAFSDKRIKEIQGRSNQQVDLKTFRRLEIINYTYKDKVSYGSSLHKKVLGQQIAQFFPQAVSTHTDVIPDIFQSAYIDKGWVSLSGHGLQVGERVKLLSEESEAKICGVVAVTADRFQVQLDCTGQVFVYGREVDDFHVVDYDALSMLNISATQEICNIIDQLQGEIVNLKAQIFAIQGNGHSANTVKADGSIPKNC